MHEVFNRMFENRLIFPAMPQLRRVLECGFGSASWAIEVAEQYPTCEVREALVVPRSRLDSVHPAEGRPEVSHHPSMPDSLFNLGFPTSAE